MRTKVTLVLVFLNLVLFYYIFYHELPAQDERKLLETRRRVLPAEVAGLDAFTRTGRASPTVHVEKRGENWWLTQPYEWPVNSNAVSRIINELQFLEHETSFAVADLPKTGQTLADYGLADPALVFTFSSAGKNYTLKIGDDTRIGNRLYLLSPDGTRIHVVGRSLADTLNLPLDQLRSPSIFTVPVFEVRSLGLQTAAPGPEQNRGSAGPKVRLRRDGPRWVFETPIVARADKGKVDTTINALNALQVKRFLEGSASDLERTGLATPSLRITLEGNARRETLLLGTAVAAPAASGPPAAAAEYYAKLEDKPAIFITTVPADILERLRSAQETLRDPHILDFDPGTVTALTVAAPGQPELNLQRVESAQGAASWQIVVRSTAGQAPQTLPAESAVVTGLLQKLQLLSAGKFLSDAPGASDLEGYGFNRPERELTLSLSTGGGPHGTDASTLVLQIGVTPGQRGTAAARIANAPYLYQIDPEVLELTPVLPRHYRQRLLRELPEGAHLTGLKLSELPANTVLLDANHPVALTPEIFATLDRPEKFRQALGTLVTQLRALRAREFTADGFNPDHAESAGRIYPWKYRLDLTVALSGSGGATAATSTLWFTERLGGTTQLAGTADFGGVTFEATQEMIDALFALTYADKHDPGPPAGPVKSGLTAPGAPGSAAPAKPEGASPKTETPPPTTGPAAATTNAPPAEAKDIPAAPPKADASAKPAPEVKPADDTATKPPHPTL
ncbi:MAG: DUF4340 domain-containing protein [Opitutales bacterium]